MMKCVAFALCFLIVAVHTLSISEERDEAIVHTLSLSEEWRLLFHPLETGGFKIVIEKDNPFSQTTLGTTGTTLTDPYYLTKTANQLAFDYPGHGVLRIRLEQAVNSKSKNLLPVFLVRIEMEVKAGDSYKSCYDMSGHHWYGGPQQKYQYWPIEKLKLTDYAYLSKEQDNCGVAERYWLSSAGRFYYVDLETPLFVDQNSTTKDHICFISKAALPYSTHRESFKHAETWAIADDIKEAHEYAVAEYLGKPSGIPDARMIKYPIWSTWARYKRPISESVVLNYAAEITDHGFPNSHIDIDDSWETCYGSLTFLKTSNKFPNVTGLTATLKENGYRVTLWVHPFINVDCEPWFSFALSKGYLVKDHSGSVKTSWWNSGSNEAAYIDFTNAPAREWFTERLKRLQTEDGIDSFKFDAGETSWSPPDPIQNGPEDLNPHKILVEYVRSVSKFGGMIEVRAGQGTQDLPVFVRMLDKDSNWSWNNGLPTLITTLLQSNMVGYTLVLPDMIGGNGYSGDPNKELFIRWLQANTFMPSMQYSYVPWDYDDEAVAISKKFTDLHAKYGDVIVAVCEKSVLTGSMVNPPVWWLNHTDQEALQIFDEFLLDDYILSAPVITEGAVTRDVYLPYGHWIDGNTGKLAVGPIWLMDYPAPLDTLPYFYNTYSERYTGKEYTG